MNNLFIFFIQKRLKLNRIFRIQFSFSHIDLCTPQPFYHNADKNAPNDTQMNESSMTINRGMR